jgi:hypothetical protein
MGIVLILSRTSTKYDVAQPYANLDPVTPLISLPRRELKHTASKSIFIMIVLSCTVHLPKGIAVQLGFAEINARESTGDKTFGANSIMRI